MKREKLYSELPNELLGAFYIYIQDNIEKGINVELMNTEIRRIEEEIQVRNIPLINLREIGLDFISKEKGFVKKHM